MNEWRSCAEWPKGVYDHNNNVTTDDHGTKGQAEAVCRRLEDEGFGGDGVHFPVKTWVEPI